MASAAESLQLGRRHHEAGQLARAEQIYRQVLEAQPYHAEALHLLGVLALQTGRCDEGIGLLERAVAANPQDSEAHANLGSAYCTAGRHTEGRAALAEAVRLAPANVDAHYNLGLALQRLDQLDKAAATYRRCLELDVDHCPALRNLGVVLQALGHLSEAEQCCRRARTLEPHQPVSHVNLGTVLKDQGRLHEALECYDEALRLESDNAQALCSRGTVLLSMGQFAAGWAGYENRDRCPDFNTLRLNEPRWDGSPLAGRTLLIHCEQGLGDTLQFVRYVKFARRYGGPVVVAAQPALIPLLIESGFGPLISRNEPLGTFDVQAPLLSLPYIFGSELGNVPSDVPYLTVDERRIARWREELSRCKGFKIGIAWQGQPRFRADRLRSIPLKFFERLTEVPCVQLISLQKGPGSEQLASFCSRVNVIDLTSRLDAEGAFLDTAAVMRSLDLVITSDTATAHLAGALGVPVWVALCSAPDWRWMLDRGDSPWYPTMRLFRQRTPGDWQAVFADMATELTRGRLTP